MRQRRHLDYVSLIGLPLGAAIILATQYAKSGRIAQLLQAEAAFIVVGGTFAAVALSHHLDVLRQAALALEKVFWNDEREQGEQTVKLLFRLASTARQHGRLAIEEDVERIKDPFLRRGLRMLVDDVPLSMMQRILDAQSLSLEDEDASVTRVYESAGGYAPTVGIIGAVLGLIHVMENLTDPGNLGSGIATAFVATVYGVGLANLVFIPIASKLRSIADSRASRRELVIQGILAIAEGHHPNLVAAQLHGMLSPRTREPVAGRLRAVG